MKTETTMDIAEYHAHPAIGKSTLDLIHRDPYLVEWSKTAPVDPDREDVGIFGDAFHAILLEPARFSETYVVQPAFNLRTNDGKAQAAEFAAANDGKTIISADDHKQLILMRDSVLAHPQARALIEANGDVERSFFWTDEKTGLNCKCRPDKMVPASHLLVDVKTTHSIAKFTYAVEDYRYYVQAPWYCDGVSHVTGEHFDMAFIVVQKTPEFGRYPVQVFMLPDDLIVFGRQEYGRDLGRYAMFLAGFQREIQLLDVHGRFSERVMDNLEVTTE